MADNHLTLELLRAVHASGRSPRDVAALALTHLRELCPHCERAFETWGKEMVAAEDGLAPAAERIDPGCLHAEGSECPPSIHEKVLDLLSLPTEAQRARLRQAPQDYKGPALAGLLLDEVRRCLPDRLREAHAIAALTRAVLQHEGARPEITALYAQALAQEANALRAQGDLRAAEVLLETARFLLASRSCDEPLVDAELDRLEGSLRRAQRRLDEALRLFERAGEAYAAAGLERERARTLVSLGMAWNEKGDLERAIEVTLLAGRLLQTFEDPKLSLCVQHNLAYYYYATGKLGRTREILAETQALYDEFGDPAIQLRRLWLQGHVARADGDLQTAEDRYREVRGGFLRSGHDYDAALVGKHVAELYAQQRRMVDLGQITEEIVSVFEAIEVYPEADAARRFLAEATGADAPPVN